MEEQSGQGSRLLGQLLWGGHAHSGRERDLDGQMLDI